MRQKNGFEAVAAGERMSGISSQVDAMHGICPGHWHRHLHAAVYRHLALHLQRWSPWKCHMWNALCRHWRHALHLHLRRRGSLHPWRHEVCCHWRRCSGLAAAAFGTTAAAPVVAAVGSTAATALGAADTTTIVTTAFATSALATSPIALLRPAFLRALLVPSAHLLQRLHLGAHVLPKAPLHHILCTSWLQDERAAACHNPGDEHPNCVSHSARLPSDTDCLHNSGAN
mmetsp:Transcript_41014/g.80970  ORF Transcript_41014/g.80970 Transcript_41014/m.80970 type:complete len:229 (+) Transcript_41014:52-738(+)